MSLHFDVTGDNSNFLRKLDEARNGIRSTSKQIEESGTSIEQMFGRMAKGAAALGAGFSAQQFASQVMKVRGEFQQLEVAFKTMLGSEEKANTLMAQLVKTAATTPFDLQSVAGGAKQLLAYGTAAEDVNGTLIRLGDIAAGLSIPLGDLVYLYGTTMAQGRLYTQDFNQFTGRGIPMISELAKQFGVAESEVKKLVESGKVGFPEVQKVIESLTNEGGKFGGLMEAQSKTITGQISNIEDSIATMYNNIGKQSEGFINNALSGVSYLVENYETIGKTILELAAVYGIYKAVLMSVAAYQSVATGIAYTVEIAELSKLIPLKQQSANQDVIAAVASGKLTQSKAEQVIALRAEISAKLASLQATKAQADAELVSATNNYKSALQRNIIAKQNMALAQSQMAIAIKSGTAEEIVAAKKNAQNAALEVNNAAIAKNNAQRTLNTATVNSNSASEALNSVQTGINTAAQETNSKSTKMLTLAKMRLAAVSKALGLSMLANPYLWVAVAAITLGYGIYKLITYQTDAEKAQEKLNKRVREFNSETEAEQAEIDRLFGKLDSAKNGTKEYDDAKRSIIDKYGEYLKGLGDEIEKLSDVELAYKAVSAAAKQAALDRAIADSTTTAQKDWADKQTELMDDLEKSIRDSDKFKGKKGSDREISAIMQMIKSDLKVGGKLAPDTQHIVDGFKMTKSISTADGPEKRVFNDVQADVDRIIQNSLVLENTMKDINEKLGNDTNDYINLTAKQIANDIAMYEAALKRFNKSGKKQAVKTHDGEMSNLMGEGEIRNNIRLLKNAKSQKDKNKENEVKSIIGSNVTKEIEDATKKVQDLRLEIENLRNGKTKVEKGKTVESTIEEKEKSLKEAESALATLTGDDKKTINSKQKKQEEANKLRVEQAELQRHIDEQNEQAKAKAVQAELELAQAKIDTMDDGFKKEQEQLELNYRKAKVDNERRAGEYVKDQQNAERKEWEKKHPKYKEEGLVFTPKTQTKDNLSPDKKKTLEDYDKAASDAKATAEKKLAKSLLEQYQSYTDERLAIEKKFNDDIEALRIQREKYKKEGNTEKVEQTDRAIAQGTKMKGEALMGHDYEQLKKSPDYVRAFENLKETSSETLNSLLSQLENAKTTAAQVLSPDQLREYTSTIQSIMDELDSRNPFQSLSDKKKELAEAEEELARAQVELENARQTAEAVKGGAKIENGVKSSKFNQKTGKIDSTKAYLSEAQALEKVKDKTENYNDAKDKTAKKSAQVQKAEKKVKDVIGDLSDSLKGLGSALGGQAGEIVGLIGDIGSFAMMAMSGVQGASTTASKAIQTVEKASVILAIISAAVQIATKIASLFKDDDGVAQYESAKEIYESYINILDRVIDKHLELAETLSGENANAAYQKAIDTVKLQNEDAKTLGRQYLNSGASKGFLGMGSSASKGRKEVEDMSWEGWNQAANALGMTIDDFKDKMGGRMTGLFDLTDEQLASLQENAGIFWSQLDSDTQEFADQIANGVGKITEILEQQMADTTLLDMSTLRSDFQDLLTDMDSDSASFADNFEGYMKNAIINSMIKEQYTGQLSAWREKFYNAMQNGVTEDEYNALKAEGQQISDEMLAKRKELADLYGWNNEDDEREASKEGFASMSQDSADELNGRFTVIQGHTYEINGSVKAIQSDTAKIAEKLSFLTNMDKNMSDMVKFSNIAITHLSNIDSNTARLENIEKTMNSIRTGIDTLNTKGLKLQR